MIDFFFFLNLNVFDSLKKMVYKKEKCQHQLLFLLFYKKSSKHFKKKNLSYTFYKKKS